MQKMCFFAFLYPTKQVASGSTATCFAARSTMASMEQFFLEPTFPQLETEK